MKILLYLSLLVSTTAYAGYLVDSDGNIVRNGFGDPWQVGSNVEVVPTTVPELPSTDDGLSQLKELREAYLLSRQPVTYAAAAAVAVPEAVPTKVRKITVTKTMVSASGKIKSKEITETLEEIIDDTPEPSLTLDEVADKTETFNKLLVQLGLILATLGAGLAAIRKVWYGK